jgi:hypothetical protein
MVQTVGFRLLQSRQVCVMTQEEQEVQEHLLISQNSHMQFQKVHKEPFQLPLGERLDQHHKLSTARQQVRELTSQAEQEGFRQMTLWVRLNLKRRLVEHRRSEYGS